MHYNKLIDVAHIKRRIVCQPVSLYWSSFTCDFNKKPVHLMILSMIIPGLELTILFQYPTIYVPNIMFKT